jgi:hypothetical protein
VFAARGGRVACLKEIHQIFRARRVAGERIERNLLFYASSGLQALSKQPFTLAFQIKECFNCIIQIKEDFQ